MGSLNAPLNVTILFLANNFRTMQRTKSTIETLERDAKYVQSLQ